MSCRVSQKVQWSRISITLVLLTVLAATVGWMPVAAAPDSEFAHFTGSLAPGETVAPIVQLLGSQDKQVNLKLHISPASGSDAVALTFTDAAAGSPFTGTIANGRAMWAALVLKPGLNTFSLHSQGTNSGPLNYELWLYSIPDAPAGWNGISSGQASGWQSHMRANFTHSGLYQFDLGVTSGRYQFMLDEDYLAKTVEATGVVSYWVSAGTHLLKIVPDSTAATTAWAVSISGPGAAANSLPYTKSGGRLGGTGNGFGQEWLPVNLAAPANANLALTLGGAAGDRAALYIYSGLAATPTYTVTPVHGGETLWWTSDLPAGVSRIKLVADAANTGSLAYNFAIHDRPAAPATWTGTAKGPAGNNSQVRFTIATAGLYDFSYGEAGNRYQFLVDGGNTIQKTVEGAGSVRFYLAAGSHELTVVQDPARQSTNWSLGIAPADVADETLPYAKSGGRLGGTGNLFGQERLPLHLAGATVANFRLTLTGELADGLRVQLYPNQAASPSYTTPLIFGGETFWWTTDLAAGLNQIQLVAETANGKPLEYELAVEPLPSAPFSWSGVGASTGGNSVVNVNLPATGTYHVALVTQVGFGQVLPDGTPLAGAAHVSSLALAGPAASGQLTEFDVPLSSGAHTFQVKQSPSFITTTWTLSITPTVISPIIAHFAGELPAGALVDPQLPLVGAEREVNFRLMVPAGTGGELALTIRDPANQIAFSGTARSGETVWGTARLRPGQNSFVLENHGAAALSYDLMVYALGEVPYDWSGVSQATGSWNSAIKLNVPTGGLYQFDLGVTSGRYQFMLDEDYLAKTVEATGVVSYWVSAGTHLLKIVPDSTAATTAWAVSISGPGAAANSLPYEKSGGRLGGTNNDFGQEWLPVNLAAPANANLALTLGGAAGDRAALYIYSGLAATPTYTVTPVYGGETLWWTSDLPAGVSRIKLVADAANTGSLDYDFAIHDRPAAPAAWTGTANGPAGNNSQVRFTIAAAGLYDFSYGAAGNRYQFLVDGGNTIRKTVEGAGSVRFYLAAGSHDLTVVQDRARPSTNWSLNIALAGVADETLPYAKSGGRLGGTGNLFGEERLPLHLAGATVANFRLTLTGELADGLRVQLYPNLAASPTYTTPLIFGGETFWWTTDLAAGLNQIQLVAEPANGKPLEYELAVEPLPSVLNTAPQTWSGVSSRTGGNSRIQIRLPVTGTYHVVADYPIGYANIFIAGPSQLNALAMATPAGSRQEFDVPLSEGTAAFEVRQSSPLPTTSWAVTVSLRGALAPVVTSLSPALISNASPRLLTIRGSNFQPGATVDLEAIAPGAVTYVNSSTLTVLVAAGVPVGTYTLTVTNPDGLSASLPAALVVRSGPVMEHWVFIPVVRR